MICKQMAIRGYFTFPKAPAVQMVYDILPSPSNLHLWSKIDMPKRPEKGSRQHILSSCKTTLADGRYRWRHDKILEVTALIITEAIQSSKFFPGKRIIRFVKPEMKSSKKQTKAQSLLSSTLNWQIRVDHRKQLKFPAHISTLRLQLDISYSPRFNKTNNSVHFLF